MLSKSFHANLNATVGVFFDSFAKISVSVAVLGGVIHLSTDVIHHRIITGVCFGLFLLNLFYYYQARIISRNTSTNVTALPSGLQASCVFVWLFGLMLPIASKTHNPLLAYQVALLANLINAIVFSLSGIILLRLQKFIPRAALFSGLAGTAFTWLAVNNLPTLVEHPLSGLLPLLIILGLMIARYNSRVPLIMLGVVLGTIIALLNHEFSWSLNNLTVDLTIQTPHLMPLVLSSEVIKYCLEYLPLIIAFAIIDAVSAVQILEESKLSNDKFNPLTSILASGFISGASTFVGNPFAMALFFGHYSWKQIGADYRYSLYNGIIYLILALTGGAAFLIALVPDWVTLPVLIIIGLTTAAVSFSALDKDEYILLVIGIVPILTELIYNKLELFALQNNISDLQNHVGMNGLFILAKGSILFSLVITTMFYYIMKHRWWLASICCAILTLFCSIGFIHSQTPQINLFNPMNYVYITGIVLCSIMAILDKKHAIKI